MLTLIATCLALGLVQAEPLPTQAPVPPRDLAGAIDGELTEIAVLGTMHLSQLDPFDPAWTDGIVDRLADWQPDLILIEHLPVGELELMQADPAFAEVLDNFGSRMIRLSEAAQASLGLSRAEAGQDLSQPFDPASGAAGRRHRAALYLAAMDPVSALVQWLALPAGEQVAGDGLTEDLVQTLREEAGRRNETTLLAAALAHRLGHDRVHPFDSHAEKASFLADMEAIMAAFGSSRVMANTMAGEDAARMQVPMQGIDSAEGLLHALRALNSPEQAALDVRVQWSSFTAADMNGLGRTRVAYWDARNLRMAGHAREIMARYPGARVLIIVGASHKPYLDDLLARAMDVRIVDTQALLD